MLFHLDIVLMSLHKYNNFNHNKVLGMAGILVTSSFIFFLSEHLGVETSKIKSFVLGGHGDSMVAMLNHTYIDGKPFSELV